MGKIIAFTNLTLDGVMQSPARPDEDTRDGFQYGGWGIPYSAMESGGEAMANVGAVLFGRRTYEDFYNVWPKRKESDFSAYFDNIQKYVVSTTLEEPLQWKNSVLLKGDIAKKLTKLKNEQDKDFVIMGSGKLIRSLMKDNIIDKYVLFIHPLILGQGHQLFANNDVYSSLKLVSSKTTDKGVIVATYEPIKN